MFENFDRQKFLTTPPTKYGGKYFDIENGEQCGCAIGALFLACGNEFPDLDQCSVDTNQPSYDFNWVCFYESFNYRAHFRKLDKYAFGIKTRKPEIRHELAAAIMAHGEELYFEGQSLKAKFFILRALERFGFIPKITTEQRKAERLIAV